MGIIWATSLKPISEETKPYLKVNFFGIQFLKLCRVEYVAQGAFQQPLTKTKLSGKPSNGSQLWLPSWILYRSVHEEIVPNSICPRTNIGYCRSSMYIDCSASSAARIIGGHWLDHMMDFITRLVGLYSNDWNYWSVFHRLRAFVVGTLTHTTCNISDRCTGGTGRKNDNRTRTSTAGKKTISATSFQRCCLQCRKSRRFQWNCV